MNSFSSRCWKFQLCILKNKKVLFLKKKKLNRCQFQNKKLCLLSQFSQRFCIWRPQISWSFSWTNSPLPVTPGSWGGGAGNGNSHTWSLNGKLAKEVRFLVHLTAIKSSLAQISWLFSCTNWEAVAAAAAVAAAEAEAEAEVAATSGRAGSGGGGAGYWECWWCGGGERRRGSSSSSSIKARPCYFSQKNLLYPKIVFQKFE